MGPHRCLDCSHRFLSLRERPRSQRQFSALAALFVLVVVAIGALYGLSGLETASPIDPFVAASAPPPVMKIAAESVDAGDQFAIAGGVPQNPSTARDSLQAIRSLEISAESGNAEAMILLGRMSRAGIGTLQNFCHAATWITKAAVSGAPEGMLELGRLYRDGVGVTKDLVRAYVWFNRSAAAHNIEAVRDREKIFHLLSAEQLKEAQHQSAKVDVDDATLFDQAACKR